MSNYEFRCPDCKKVICTTSTGVVPEVRDKVECIFCGRISVVQYTTSTLEVTISSIKNTPSKLDASKQEQVK